MVRIWTETDAQALVGQTESARLEFKSGRLFESRDAAIDALSKEVSAFANSEGGTLVLGISEERRGATRTAASLDGVDGSEVTREWLQQVVESNISPYLPGIRYRHVPLSGELSGRVCIIIEVPQGTTAYQAKDRRYYGRSEFEVRALPDHEIRLRMQRSRNAVATVEIFEWTGTGDPDWGVDTAENYDLTPPEIEDMLPLIVGSETLAVDVRASFRLGVCNVGEVTLRDFLVEYNFRLDDRIELARGGAIAGPGRDEPRKYRFSSDADIRVYPGDRVRFPNEVWTIAATEMDAFKEGTAVLTWRVFIDNAPSVSGTIDLSRRFAFNALS